MDRAKAPSFLCRVISSLTLTFTFAFLFVLTFAFTRIPTLSFAADNLIPNPQFLTPEEEELLPYFWYHGSSDIESVTKSEFSVGPAGSPPLRSLGIKGGEDRSGQWWCNLDGLEKGRRYRLSFMVYREEFSDGLFPEVELFGSRVRMSSLLSYGTWQDFSLIFEAMNDSTTLKFTNDHPFMTYFASPVMVSIEQKAESAEQKTKSKEQRTEGAAADRPFVPDIFPLVAYGAKTRDFPFVKEMGFNGAVIGVNGENLHDIVNAAEKAGLKIVADVRDEATIKKISASASPLLGWYVDDEPEGRSVPAEEIMSRVKRVRDAGSRQPAFMAMVRPEFANVYRDAADIILMDQYPVPHEPLIWLSKSMDEARRGGAEQVWAVIQIFGGQGWKGKGWDREPTYEEMKALSYLAIVHGAKGLFFYTVNDGNYDLSLDPAHLGDVKRLLRELGALSPYFLSDPAGTPDFLPDSLYSFAPDGTRPVHGKVFRSGKQTVLVAVNVLDKEVQGRLAGIGKDIPWFDEYFSGRRYVVKDDNIMDRFMPYEVKLYIAGRDFRRARIMDGRTGSARGNFYAEVADSPLLRNLGLMFRDLPSEERALLIDGDGDIGIHALNTKAPFDLIFLDSLQRVSAVYPEITPCTERKACRRYASKVPSRMALEVKAGVARKLGISEGDRLEFY